jgi:hypothetical protein
MREEAIYLMVRAMLRERWGAAAPDVKLTLVPTTRQSGAVSKPAIRSAVLRPTERRKLAGM